MSAAGKHRILIVEDDALVRMTACDMLIDTGHEILEAEHADQAISILEKCPDITVVFTDIDMPPGRNGVRLAATVRKRWPPVLIIATSGRVRIGDEELPSGSRFMPKPYTRAMFEKTLAEVTTDRF